MVLILGKLTREIKSGLFSNFRKEIQKEVEHYSKDGYEEIEEDNHITLLIEFIASIAVRYFILV